VENIIPLSTKEYNYELHTGQTSLTLIELIVYSTNNYSTNRKFENRLVVGGTSFVHKRI
jgi:hypothetical protein